MTWPWLAAASALSTCRSTYAVVWTGWPVAAPPVPVAITAAATTLAAGPPGRDALIASRPRRPLRAAGATPRPGRDSGRRYHRCGGTRGQRRPDRQPPSPPFACSGHQPGRGVHIGGEPGERFGQELIKVGCHLICSVHIRVPLLSQVRASSRSRRRPRDAADLTVPSGQPSSAAVSASVSCSQ